MTTQTAELRGSTYRITAARVGARVLVSAERLVSRFNGREEWKRLPKVPAGLDGVIAEVESACNA